MAGNQLRPRILTYVVVGNAARVEPAANSGAGPYAWDDFVGDGKIVDEANEAVVSDWGTIVRSGSSTTFQPYGFEQDPFDFAGQVTNDPVAMTIAAARAAEGKFHAAMATLHVGIMDAAPRSKIDIVRLKVSDAFTRPANGQIAQATLDGFSQATASYLRGTIQGTTDAAPVDGVPTYAVEIVPEQAVVNVDQS